MWFVENWPLVVVAACSAMFAALYQSLFGGLL